jgi:hypothetical protein
MILSLAFRDGWEFNDCLRQARIIAKTCHVRHEEQEFRSLAMNVLGFSVPVNVTYFEYLRKTPFMTRKFTIHVW